MDQNGFIATKIGLIPHDWGVSPLKEIATITDCEHKTAPPSKIPTEWISIRSSDIGIGHLDFTEKKFIAEEVYAEWTRRKEPEPGEIIFTREAPVGHTAIVPKSPKIALGQRMVLLSPRSVINSRFLMYILITQKMQKYIERLSVGTTAKRIDVAEIGKLPIPVPPKTEQENIIKILANVDTQIEVTNQLIEQETTLKKGLMQRLLTRGIGHTRFKKTKIGEIPESWDVKKLRSVVHHEKRNVEPLDYPEETFEYYSIPAFQEKGFPVYTLGSEILSMKQVVENEMVLFGKLNPRVPKVWLVSSDTKYRKIASTEFIPLQSKFEINPHFLFYLCWSHLLMERSKTLTTGTTQSRMRVETSAFMSLPIPLPPKNEQVRIAEILSNIDKKINLENETLSNVQLLKKGFMQVLLTGKVRVKV